MVCPVDLSLPGLGGVFFTAAGFAGAAVGFAGVAAGFAVVVGFAVVAGFAGVAGFACVVGVTTLGWPGVTSVGVIPVGMVVGVDVASYSLTILQMMKMITTTVNSRRADVLQTRRGILWNVSNTPLEMLVRLLRKRSAAVGPPSSYVLGVRYGDESKSIGGGIGEAFSGCRGASGNLGATICS